MRTSEGKGSACLVIEERRFPTRAVVAVGARGHAGLGKLGAMNVLMTLFALSRRGREIHVNEGGLEGRRFMAIDTGGSAVHPE